MLVGGLFGLLMQRIMLGRMEQNLSIMIMTLGFGYVLHGGASLVFGGDPQILDHPAAVRDISLGDLWLTWQDAAIVVAAAWCSSRSGGS